MNLTYSHSPVQTVSEAELITDYAARGASFPPLSMSTPGTESHCLSRACRDLKLEACVLVYVDPPTDAVEITTTSHFFPRSTMETHLSENVAFKQGILCVVER